MIRIFQAAWLILGLAWAQSAVADPNLKDLAARTEVRAIETLTLTDQQFLTGDKNGKSVTIAGQLRFPQGASGRLPVVILQHGSGGLNAGHELWSKHFNEMGVASFLVDSFSGRAHRLQRAGGKRDAQGSEGVRADGVQARMTKPSK